MEHTNIITYENEHLWRIWWSWYILPTADFSVLRHPSEVHFRFFVHNTHVTYYLQKGHQWMLHHDRQLKHKIMMAQKGPKSWLSCISNLISLDPQRKHISIYFFLIFLMYLLIMTWWINKKTFIIINRVISGLWWPKSGSKCKCFRFFRVILTLNFCPGYKF